MQSTESKQNYALFEEDIELQEGPVNDLGGFGSLHDIGNQPSYNTTVPNTQVFRAQRKRPRDILIITIGCVVFFGGLIAIIAATTFNRMKSAPENSLTYGEACEIGSNQCILSQGLSCLNGYCLCQSPYSWNSATLTCALLTYDQPCTDADQCNSRLGLNCTNNRCKCVGSSRWDVLSKICITISNNTLSYGESCTIGNNQCNSSAGLDCTGGNCMCQNHKSWINSSCVCGPGMFLDSSNSCRPLLSYNESCASSNQCDSTKELYCISSRCLCNATIQFWKVASQQCLPLRNYNETCADDSPCLSKFICPTTSVPGSSRCECPPSTHFDQITAECVSHPVTTAG